MPGVAAGEGPLGCLPWLEAPTTAPGPRAHQQLSDARKQHQEHFRQAVLYAKSAKDTPEYKDVADARGQSTFNVAVADFLHPPEIQQIDLSAYKGAPGESITTTAVDDIKVKTVGILIVNDDGTLVEKGAAIPTHRRQQLALQDHRHRDVSIRQDCR